MFHLLPLINAQKVRAARVSQSRAGVGEHVILLKRIAQAAEEASTERAPERIVRIRPDEDGWNRVLKDDRGAMERRTPLRADSVVFAARDQCAGDLSHMPALKAGDCELVLAWLA